LPVPGADWKKSSLPGPPGTLHFRSLPATKTGKKVRGAIVVSIKAELAGAGLKNAPD
jgi:hypothetical protein